MVTENQGGDQTPKPDERSLVVHTKQTSLEDAVNKPFLQASGFSPIFLEQLGRLNDVLTHIRPPISSVSISLIPGETPLISTSVEHSPLGYRVFVNSNRRTASLSVETLEELDPNFGLPLRDIQDFVRSTFPDISTRLFVSRNLWNDVSADEDLDKDLFTLSEHELKPLTTLIDSADPETGARQIKGTRYEHQGEVRLAVQKDPLFLIRFRDRWHHDARTEDDKTVILHILRFLYQGSPSEVEGIMESVAKLFDKPPFYPYRREDLLAGAEE